MMSCHFTGRYGGSSSHDVRINFKDFDEVCARRTARTLGKDVIFNFLQPWRTRCCILRGPGGEPIMDVVPGGTELELQLRRGVGQAAHICYNLHVKSTGVY